MTSAGARALLIRLLVNTVAIYAAVELIPGLHFDQGAGKFLLVAAVFGLVNALVRPLLTILTCPLVLITLGLFVLVINALMLLLTARLSGALGLGFSVEGFWPAFWGALVISVVSTVLSLAVSGDGGPRATVD